MVDALGLVLGARVSAGSCVAVGPTHAAYLDNGALAASTGANKCNTLAWLDLQSPPTHTPCLSPNCVQQNLESPADKSWYACSCCAVCLMLAFVLQASMAEKQMHVNTCKQKSLSTQDVGLDG